MIKRMIILLLVAAACMPPGPPDVYDWCYKWDFSSANSFAVSYGAWEDGVGYVTDAAYRLALSYGASSTVNPSRVIVGLQRVDEGDISIYAYGTIFGIGVDRQETLPTAVPSIEVGVDAASADVIGINANVAIQASSAFAVTSLTVYGKFENPFGVSNCGNLEPTATVIIPTYTPFPTLTLTPVPDTPTHTVTPSLTPTITETPSYCDTWEQTFDFTVNDGGWTPRAGSDDQPTYGEYAAGQGWSTQDKIDNSSIPDNANRAVFPGIDFTSTTVTYISFVFDLTKGFYNSGSGHAVVLRGGTGFGSTLLARTANQSTSGNDQVATWTGSMTMQMVAVFVRSSIDDSSPYNYSGSALIKSVTLRGVGVNPFTGIPTCATPTPTETFTPSDTPPPSNTPLATNTRTPNPTFTPRFTQGPTQNPSRTPIPIYVPPTWTRTSTPHPNPSDTPVPNPTATLDLTTTQTWTPIATFAGSGGYGGPDGGTPNPNGNIGGDVGGLGGAIIGSVSNFIATTFNWLGSAANTLNGITSAWNNTAAIVPPGVPQCKTAPLESELCAIWYILTYTVFSGTVGSLLIPIAVVVVDLVSLFLFLRLARAILARAARIIQ